MRTKSLPIPLHPQATRPRMRASAGTVASHIGRHCGTGIWPARDIPSVDLMMAGRCASLPTAPPAPARTPAEHRGSLTSGGDFRRETDCLLEGDGFEPSVPRLRRNSARLAGCDATRVRNTIVRVDQLEREKA